MPIDWAAAEGAIYDWIERVLKAPISPIDVPVVWRGQDFGQPGESFATLAIPTIIPIGPPEILQAYDAARDPDLQGLEVSTGGPAELTLSIAIRTREAAGPHSAIALAMRGFRELQTEEALEQLRAVGLGVKEIRPPLSSPNLLGTDFNGRVTLEAVLRFTDYAVAYQNWIEKFAATAQLEHA